tara:strand:- start:533 stop:799 length:267 start_codon:yes stop_codon:yes gene_type:complete
MLIHKTKEQWNAIVKEKDDRNKMLEGKLKKTVEKCRALYSRVRDLQDIDEAHKKHNGVLQRKVSNFEQKIKDLQNDRLNKGREAGIDV